jgi:hypothetical protein
VRCADYVCDIFVFILKLELKIEKQMTYFSINRQCGTKGNVQTNLSFYSLYSWSCFCPCLRFHRCYLLINMRNRQMMVNEYVSHIIVSSMWLLMCS